MKTLKQLIQQEQAANAAQDNKLRCFALNHFGKGQHPWAEPNNLKFFKPDYVRECLLKCAAHVAIRPELKQRAKELAQ